jgi:hypothetical protein
MVEMEMRVDDQVDARRVPVDRFEPGADLLVRLKVDPEQPGEAWAQPPGRIMLAIGVQPGIEQRPATRVLDQKHRDRHGDVALAAFHQVGKLARQRSAGEGVELDGHQRFSIVGPGGSGRLAITLTTASAEDEYHLNRARDELLQSQRRLSANVVHT